MVDLYEEPINVLMLSPLGKSDAQWLEGARDVRENQLIAFDTDERAHFANYGYYAMLSRAGLDHALYREEMNRARIGCASLLESLDIGDSAELLYSPVQQGDDALLDRAAAIEQEHP
jgi:uncharacterized protein YfiM (DUF2279 family)